LEDYEDYLPTHHLTKWTAGHTRYDNMLRYCRTHNHIGDYEKFFEKWNDEELANIAITLCHMVDKMMMTYQKKKEEEFVTEGGIRERMTAARLGYRTNQREAIEQLSHEVERLKKENEQLKKQV
jgi:four helix bundle suffix protein